MSASAAISTGARKLVRKHRRRIAALAALLLFYVFIGGSEGFYVQWRLGRRITYLEAENARLRELIAVEKRRIHLLEHDLKTIERIARERDGLVRPGEHVFQIVAPAADEPAGAGD